MRVSRVTLREALRKLAHDRLLVKVPGKGTFVALEHVRGLSRVKYAGFLEDLQERVLSLSVVEVEVARVPPTEELRTRLQLEPGETELVVFKRLRHIEDEPFSYTLNYLPGDRRPDQRRAALPSAAAADPPRGFAHPDRPGARDDCGLTGRRGSRPQAEHSGVSPVMHMKRVMYTTDDRPLELVETYYRADKYHYSVNLVRVKRGSTWRWQTEVETSA